MQVEVQQEVQAKDLVVEVMQYEVSMAEGPRGRESPE